MTENEAEQFMKMLIERVGVGYHPDTPLAEYVTYQDNTPIFTEAEIRHLQPHHDQMMITLHDPYACGLRLFAQLGLLDN